MNNAFQSLRIEAPISSSQQILEEYADGVRRTRVNGGSVKLSDFDSLCLFLSKIEGQTLSMQMDWQSVPHSFQLFLRFYDDHVAFKRTGEDRIFRSSYSQVENSLREANFSGFTSNSEGLKLFSAFSGKFVEIHSTLVARPYATEVPTHKISRNRRLSHLFLRTLCVAVATAIGSHLGGWIGGIIVASISGTILAVFGTLPTPDSNV